MSRKTNKIRPNLCKKLVTGRISHKVSSVGGNKSSSQISSISNLRFYLHLIAMYLT